MVKIRLDDEQLAALAARVTKPRYATDMMKLLREAVGTRRELAVALAMLERDLVPSSRMYEFTRAVFGGRYRLGGAPPCEGTVADLPHGALIAAIRALPKKSTEDLLAKDYCRFADALLMHAEVRAPEALAAEKLGPAHQRMRPWVQLRCGRGGAVPEGLLEEVVAAYFNHTPCPLPVWTLRDGALTPLPMATYEDLCAMIRETIDPAVTDDAIEALAEKARKGEVARRRARADEMRTAFASHLEHARGGTLSAEDYNKLIWASYLRELIEELPLDARDRFLLALLESRSPTQTWLALRHFDLASDSALERGLQHFLTQIASQLRSLKKRGDQDALLMRVLHGAFFNLGDRLEAPLTKHLALVDRTFHETILDATKLSDEAYDRVLQGEDAKRPAPKEGDAPPAEESENLERLLSSREQANVRLGVQLLKSRPLPQELTELTVALMLFSPDKEIRKELLDFVSAERPKIGEYFKNDKRAYARMTDGEKLAKLVRDFDKAMLSLNSAQLALSIFRVIVNNDSPDGIVSNKALPLVLRYPEIEERAFALLADLARVHVCGLSKRIPAGLGQLKQATFLRLEGKTTDHTNVAELAQLPKLKVLELELDPTDLRAFEPASKSVEHLTVWRCVDLSPLATWSNLKSLALRAVPDEERERFRAARPDVTIE